MSLSPHTMETSTETQMPYTGDEAVVIGNTVYFDGTEPIRVKVYPCPHCGKRFQRVKAHLAKSGCGQKEKEKEREELREAGRRMREQNVDPEGDYAREQVANAGAGAEEKKDDKWRDCVECGESITRWWECEDGDPYCAGCFTQAGVSCGGCAQDDCPQCSEESESEDEETPEVTLFHLIQAWLARNATEWSGKTARDIAGAIGTSKHEVNKTLYANKQFVQMTVAGQSAPTWRCA
jgi:hypothetical protein